MLNSFLWTALYHSVRRLYVLHCTLVCLCFPTIKTVIVCPAYSLKSYEQTFTHSGVEVELGQVVSWVKLPGVLQVESHCACVSLRCGYIPTKCTLRKSHRTIIDLEASDWKRPAVEREE